MISIKADFGEKAGGVGTIVFRQQDISRVLVTGEGKIHVFTDEGQVPMVLEERSNERFLRWLKSDLLEEEF